MSTPPDSEGNTDGATGRGRDDFSRRRLLALLGAGVTALAGSATYYYEGADGPPDSQADGSAVSPTETPSGGAGGDDGDVPLNYREMGFDRKVDAVADLGLDPTGETSVESRLAEALSEPGTLVAFPSGTYRFDESVRLTEGPLGLLGRDSVTFVPASGFDTRLFDGQTEGLDGVLIENIDIDVRASDTTAGIRLLCQDRFHIQDVRYLGRGARDSPENTISAFSLAIRNEDGEGILRGAVAKKGSRSDRYKRGNGRIGVWVGWSNKGTVRIEDCDFREFGNNGIYASRTPGHVQVVDSYFLNNNVAGIRIGGEGSYVENCTVEIDFEKYTGPPLDDISSGFNTRAIVVEQGLAKSGPPIPAGAEIRGCAILARSSPKAQSVIEQSPQARSLVISDTEIQCDIDGTPAVRRGPPGAIPYRPDRRTPPSPHWTRLRNVTIIGTAADGAAIDLYEAPQSAVENCTIHQFGTDRDGILLTHSPQSTIENSEIRTGGYPILISVDPGFSPDQELLCLDGKTTFASNGVTSLDQITTPPTPLRVHSLNSRTDIVCLTLDSNVATRPQFEALPGPLQIGITDLENGIPVGGLPNES